MLKEDILLTKPDLRSRGKFVQGADSRRTGTTLRRIKIDSERISYHQYLIHFDVDEHDELCNDVFLSLNKKKRWEAVEALEEQWISDCNEDNITYQSAAVVTTIYHYKRPTNRWTCEKIKKLYLNSNFDENSDDEEQADNSDEVGVNAKRAKLRVGRKGFVGAKRSDPGEHLKPVTHKADQLYEVLKFPKPGAYPLNRFICRCRTCRQSRSSNKGKKKQSARAHNLELRAD